MIRAFGTLDFKSSLRMSTRQSLIKTQENQNNLPDYRGHVKLLGNVFSSQIRSKYIEVASMNSDGQVETILLTVRRLGDHNSD